MILQHGVTQTQRMRMKECYGFPYAAPLQQLKFVPAGVRSLQCRIVQMEGMRMMKVQPLLDSNIYTVIAAHALQHE